MFEQIDESNYILYAAKYYDNPDCTDELEFYDDLCRIKYIKRLLNKYEETGVLKERLILNHLICLYNVFHPVVVTRILCFKLYPQLSLLKPFLEYLSYWPIKPVIKVGPKSVLIDPNLEGNKDIKATLGRV